MSKTATTLGAFMIFDESAKKWSYHEGKKNFEEIKVVMNISNKDTIIYKSDVEIGSISRRIKYIPKGTFHQWKDDGKIYGIRFEDESQAENFLESITAIINALKATSVQSDSKVSIKSSNNDKTNMGSIRKGKSPVVETSSSTTRVPNAVPPQLPVRDLDTKSESKISLIDGPKFSSSQPPKGIPSPPPKGIPPPPPKGIPPPPPRVNPPQNSAPTGGIAASIRDAKLKSAENSSATNIPPPKSKTSEPMDFMAEMKNKQKLREAKAFNIEESINEKKNETRSNPVTAPPSSVKNSVFASTASIGQASKVTTPSVTTPKPGIQGSNLSKEEIKEIVREVIKEELDSFKQQLLDELKNN